MIAETTLCLNPFYKPPYVTDGMKHGIPSRFMNHSREPNCRIFTISKNHADTRIYDIPSSHPRWDRAHIWPQGRRRENTDHRWDGAQYLWNTWVYANEMAIWGKILSWVFFNLVRKLDGDFSTRSPGCRRTGSDCASKEPQLSISPGDEVTPITQGSTPWLRAGTTCRV